MKNNKSSTPNILNSYKKREENVMLSRVSAEFETPDLAEAAVRKVREKCKSVHSAGIISNKTAEKASRLQGGRIYTVIPTAVTSHNYYTSVIESPASKDTVAEPYRRRSASMYIVCDSEDINNVCSVLNSMGGIRIHPMI